MKPANRKLLRRALGAIALGALAAPLATTVKGTQVSAACDPGRPNDGLRYFDGWFRTHSQTVTGSMSTITVKDVHVGNSPAGVTSWTMLEDQARWAQAGWLKHPVLGHVDLIQYWSGPNDISTIFGLGGVQVGQHRPYRVEYVQSAVTPPVFTFYVDGVLAHHDEAVFVPNGGQQFGEIQSLADQMPGGTQSHEVFNQSQIRFGAGWETYFGVPHNDSGHFGNSKISGSRLEIWDHACAT